MSRDTRYALAYLLAAAAITVLILAAWPSR
jgi:hypothetical protein